ncbi:MAG: hypothetical protein ABW277_04220 [Longimicrobiaceae bacterium]
MIVRPIIGGWEPPRIERIASVEQRRLAVLPVPGLAGDLHQDLGRGALAVEIAGSLSGDEARDAFLVEVRARFLAGEPVDFVADIVAESELEQVLIEELRLEEVAGHPDSFRYAVVLREYTEPPEPPAPGMDFGLELDPELDLLAGLGLDMLDLPALLPTLPEIGDVLAPLQPAAEALNQAVAGAGVLLDPLKKLLGGG